MSDERGIRVNFEAALVEFRAAEQTYLRLVARAGALDYVGEYTAEVRTALQKMSDRIYAGEMQLYRLMQVALPAAVFSRIPAPSRLPVPGGTEPTATATAGLGAAPIVWAALVLLIAAGVILVGYLGAALIHEFYHAVETAIRARENGRRYEAELAATQRRYEVCLRAGGTPESCAASVPMPVRPEEDEKPPARSALDWLLVCGAIGAVAWGGYKVWTLSRGARSAPSLRGGDADPKPLRSRGRGRAGYQMQVR